MVSGKSLSFSAPGSELKYRSIQNVDKSVIPPSKNSVRINAPGL